MASGNRSPGPRPPKFDTEATYVRLPVELVFVVKCYASAMRYNSVTHAIQHLLESNPELVEFARKLYDEGNSTSPPS
jgi:hypothetical protein